VITVVDAIVSSFSIMTTTHSTIVVGCVTTVTAVSVCSGTQSLVLSKH
jgi:hypothetical protein